MNDSNQPKNPEPNSSTSNASALSRHHDKLVWLVMGVVLLVVLLVFTFNPGLIGMQPKVTNPFPGTVFKKALPIKSFALKNQDQQPFTNASLKNRWTFIFFGYTHCPDVCPNSMTTMKILAMQLRQDKSLADTQYVFVSVDRKRDTPKRIAEWVHYFDRGFTGVYGADVELKKLAGSLSVFFKAEQAKSGKYEVAHTPHIFLINPEGKWHALFRSPHEPKIMQKYYRDIRKKAL